MFTKTSILGMLVQFISGTLLSGKLANYLLKDYNKAVTPVLNHNTSVNVEFGMNIIQIINFNEREQHITVKTWLRKRWPNELLTWKPEEWGGVTELHFDQSYLWVPDILLYNNADDKYSVEDNYKNPIELSYDGTCYWANPVTFRVFCEVDISYFPFDKQQCYMKFGPWLSPTQVIDMSIENRPVLTDNYHNSTEWRLQGVNVKRNQIGYKGYSDEYTDVTYHIRLLRKPKYYVFNVIIPCAVLVNCILVGFYLPVESGERISLVMTILLAVVLFLQLVNDALPRNSESLPVLSIFYLAIMAESVLSLVMTCMTVRIYYNHVPKWAEAFLINHFAVWCAMNKGTTYFEMRKRHKVTEKTLAEEFGATVENKNNEDKNRKEGEIELLTSRQRESILKRSISQPDAFSTSTQHQEIVQSLRRIYAETSAITKANKESEENEFKQDQWKYLAQLVDHFFFWVFLFAVTLTSVCILVPAFLKYN